MAKWLSLVVVLGILFAPFQVRLVSAEGNAPNDWQVIRPGIDYQKFHLTSPRPIDIFVGRMDRSDLSTTIETAVGKGYLAYGNETVRGMAARYNQVVNAWGGKWGPRNDVAIAINGYFFDPSGTPWSGVIHSGWYAQRFTEIVGDAGLAWTLNRTVHIGKCVYHTASKQFITFTRSGYTPNIRGINIPANTEELILYTPQYAPTTQTKIDPDDPDVLEILVEMSRPTLVLPDPAMAKGTIKAIVDKTGNTPLPFDHVVIAAWGTVRQTLLEKMVSGEFMVGDEVGITQEITDCNADPTNNWTKTYASLGGDYHFLIDSAPQSISNPDAAVPNSRTVVGFNGQYIYFVVVDGWNKNVSEGITIPELATFMVNSLGATWAVSMDSGGSSTMVVNGEVVNNTSCNYNRNCGMLDQEGTGQIPRGIYLEPQFEPTAPTSVTIEEPPVGTGLMMVSVQGMRASSTFTPTQVVSTTMDVAVRLGPGLNYASLNQVTGGSSGQIMEHATGLNGVLANDSYWWRVMLGDITGWLPEDRLVGGQLPPNGENLLNLFLPVIIQPQ